MSRAIMGVSPFLRVVFSFVSLFVFVPTPVKGSEDLLTTWNGLEIAECLSGNIISVPGHRICVRKMSKAEVSAVLYYRRLNYLKDQEVRANIDVETGYDSSVSLGEFQRRLNTRSRIEDEIREMEYGR